MATGKNNSQEEKLAEFTKLLESARKLQDDILTYGLDAADIYVEDIDGDWLENWDEDDSDFDLIISLLESDESVALRVRKRVGEKSLSEIASELDKIWQIPKENDRIYEVKKMLGGGVNVGSINRDESDENEEDENEILELAEELLDKLAKIFEEQE